MFTARQSAGLPSDENVVTGRGVRSSSRPARSAIEAAATGSGGASFSSFTWVVVCEPLTFRVAWWVT